MAAEITVPSAPGGDTRGRILHAAQDVFGRFGYAGGRTLEIATGAGVTERTLFRHFPTKVELFIAAVVEPFHDYIKAFVDDWRIREHGVRTAWDEAYRFYDGLFELLETHRGLVVALVAAREHEDPSRTHFPALDSELADLLTSAEPTLETEAAAREFAGHPALNVRFMFGLAITACVHGDWIFPQDRRPSREELLRETTAFTLRGLGAKPDEFPPT